MPTIPLPAMPNMAQLRNQSRELQRAVRRGEPWALAQVQLDAAEPQYRLSAAQRAIARRYGFTGWPRLARHVEAISAHAWVYPQPQPGEPDTDRFLRLACLNYTHDDPAQWAEAARLLRADPGLPSTGIAAAAACADPRQVRRHLDGGASASRPTGPYGWPPLMYLSYARLDPGSGDTVRTARLLLDAGADPTDGRFFLGLPTPFTVLTGAFGGGEAGQPPHPHAVPLARTLLAAGADPNDGQTLYNRMFTATDDFLVVLFEFGLGRGDGGRWRRTLPDLVPAPHAQLRELLTWAVRHDQRDRVALLAANGADITAPLRDGATPLAEALRSGHPELAGLLRALGAPEPHLDPVDTFIAAALAGDADAVHATPDAVLAAARQRRPALVVWAAGQRRPAAVELLVAAGFDVNALGRADLPREQPWQTALHTAVERDDPAMAELLLALGADPGIHDARFDATPLDWAHHLGRPALAARLTG